MTTAQQKYYQRNKERWQEYGRKYYQENKERQLKLQEERKLKDPEKFKHDARKRRREHDLRLRMKVLTRFEIKCKHCGFSDWRALQIDHINGGGNKETKKMNTHTYYNLLLNMDEKKLKEKYQCLCANCNWIKRVERKEYSIYKK